MNVNARGEIGMVSKQGELTNLIWRYISEYNARVKENMPDAYHHIKITKKDIAASVSYHGGGEHRISGEEPNNFSLFYVNYYDLPENASAMIAYLRKHGWESEWYSAGYIVAYKWR